MFKYLIGITHLMKQKDIFNKQVRMFNDSYNIKKTHVIPRYDIIYINKKEYKLNFERGSTRI